MADEPENLTLRILQELRDEMRGMRVDLTDRMDDLFNRLNGNNLILNMLAGFVHDHGTRIDKLESR